MALVLEKLKTLELQEIKDLLKERRVQYGLLAGLVGVYLLRRLLKKKRYNLPPGPWGLPLIGNMLGMKSITETNKNFTKWRRQYGDVFTVHLGPAPCIVLTTPAVIREAFITKGNQFDGRIHVPSMDRFTDGGKDIFMAQPGPVWKLQRQIAHAAMRKHASGSNLERNLENAVESFISAVNRHEDKVVEIPDEMMKMTYNFLASVCFGRQFEYNDPWLINIQRLVKEIEEKVGSGLISDVIPALAFLDRNKMKLMEECLREFKAMFEKELDEHKKDFDPNHIRDLTDEILWQMKVQEEKPEKDPLLAELTECHLTHILSDVFSAGTDSSRLTLAILIGHLAQYQDIQAKVHKELDRVLGDSNKVTLKNKDQLAYTNAVLHESMRIETAVATGIPHTTTADTSLGKYTIPKGTIVMAHVHGVHLDPENFENPEKFNPDRWIDENGKFKYQPYKFIPFSMGPRVCVGESLARVNMHMFTAMLLHKYEFKSVDGQPFVLKRKDFGTEPYKLRLVERF